MAFSLEALDGRIAERASASPDEGYTAGSQSMQNSGTAIRHAAAQVREILLGEAARRFAVEQASLRSEGRIIWAQDGRSATFSELVSSTVLHVEAGPQFNLKPPQERLADPTRPLDKAPSGPN